MTTDFIGRSDTTPHGAFRSVDMARPSRFSEDIWRIRWTDHLPFALGSDGSRVHYSTFDRAQPFLAANLAAIVEEDPTLSPFLQKASTDSKVRYLRQNGDYFEFKDDGDRTVGFM